MIGKGAVVTLGDTAADQGLAPQPCPLCGDTGFLNTLFFSRNSRRGPKPTVSTDITRHMIMSLPGKLRDFTAARRLDGGTVKNNRPMAHIIIRHFASFDAAGDAAGGVLKTGRRSVTTFDLVSSFQTVI